MTYDKADRFGQLNIPTLGEFEIIWVQQFVKFLNYIEPVEEMYL